MSLRKLSDAERDAVDALRRLEAGKQRAARSRASAEDVYRENSRKFGHVPNQPKSGSRPDPAVNQD